MYDHIAIRDERQKEAASVPLKKGSWQQINGKRGELICRYKNLIS
jgi:hypothetical protein